MARLQKLKIKVPQRVVASSGVFEMIKAEKERINASLIKKSS